MGHLSIHCDACGSDWIVYPRDDWKARVCPVCGKAIDPGTWSREVKRAFAGMEAANMALAKDQALFHGALFTVSYIPDVIFPNKGNAEELDQLREEIEELKETIKNLTERM